jgi:hypothetical protein
MMFVGAGRPALVDDVVWETRASSTEAARIKLIPVDEGLS